MRNGQIPLEKYVITKSLTKSPEAYPDARNQPHVEVSNNIINDSYHLYLPLIQQFMHLGS